MEKTVLCNKKMKSHHVNFNLSDDEMNIIQKKFIIILENLQ